MAKKPVDAQKVIQTKRENPNLTQAELGAMFGITKQGIGQMFKRHGVPFDENGGIAKAFDDHRGDLLKMKQAEVLSHINQEKLEKASAKDLATIYGILHDKEHDLKGAGSKHIAVFFQIQAAACEVRREDDRNVVTINPAAGSPA